MGITKVLFLTFFFFRCTCQVLPSVHSVVPSTCPTTKRARMTQEQGTGHTIIGELNEDLPSTFFSSTESFRHLYVNTGGVYLLPQPVPFDATLLSLRGFGFVDETMNVTESLESLPVSQPEVLENYDHSLAATPFLFVSVYRPTKDGSAYRLVYQLTQLNHGVTPGRLPADPDKGLNWEVEAGDFIGAYIPRECVNQSHGVLMCPSQINLRTENCRSAFYHPALEGVDNLSSTELKEVSLQLNLEAILSARLAASTVGDMEPSDGSSEIFIILALVGILNVIIIVVVAAILICTCWIIRRKKESAPELDKYDDCHNYATTKKAEANSAQGFSGSIHETIDDIYTCIDENDNYEVIDQAFEGTVGQTDGGYYEEMEANDEDTAFEDEITREHPPDVNYENMNTNNLNSESEKIQEDENVPTIGESEEFFLRESLSEGHEAIETFSNEAYAVTVTKSLTEQIETVTNEAYVSNTAKLSNASIIRAKNGSHAIVLYENTLCGVRASCDAIPKEIPIYVNIYSARTAETLSTH